MKMKIILSCILSAFFFHSAYAASSTKRKVAKKTYGPRYEIMADLLCFSGSPTGMVRELMIRKVGADRPVYLHSRELQKRAGSLYIENHKIWLKKTQRSEPIQIGSLDVAENACLNLQDPVSHLPILTSTRQEVQVHAGLEISLKKDSAQFSLRRNS